MTKQELQKRQDYANGFAKSLEPTPKRTRGKNIGLGYYNAIENGCKVKYHKKPIDKVIVKHGKLDSDMLLEIYENGEQLPVFADMTQEQVLKYCREHKDN